VRRCLADESGSRSNKTTGRRNESSMSRPIKELLSVHSITVHAHNVDMHQGVETLVHRTDSPDRLHSMCPILLGHFRRSPSYNLWRDYPHWSRAVFKPDGFSHDRRGRTVGRSRQAADTCRIPISDSRHYQVSGLSVLAGETLAACCIVKRLIAPTPKGVRGEERVKVKA
jgi:hypothetical protein